jgi:hypothetical protein
MLGPFHTETSAENNSCCTASQLSYSPDTFPCRMRDAYKTLTRCNAWKKGTQKHMNHLNTAASLLTCCIPSLKPNT